MGDFFMRKICLIGGDKRNLELAKFLLEDKENNISIFANEKMKEELTNKKIEDDELKNIIKKIHSSINEHVNAAIIVQHNTHKNISIRI